MTAPVHDGPLIPRQPIEGEGPDWFDKMAANAHAEWVAEDDKPPPLPVNPKQVYGDTKVPLHLFPMTAIAGGSLAFLEGKLKYGSDNFRGAPVEAMTYVRATLGHVIAWAEGRDIDPDSGLDELWKALACVALLIDAKEAGTLIDNRKYPGGYHQMLARLEPHVKRLMAMHADKKPLHYTIADKGKV